MKTAVRNFWIGFCSLSLDSHQPIKRVSVPQKSDLEALRSDWIAVGSDIETAMKLFADEQEQVAGKKQA